MPLPLTSILLAPLVPLIVFLLDDLPAMLFGALEKILGPEGVEALIENFFGGLKAFVGSLIGLPGEAAP
jgi:hypothetical protein